MLGDNGSYTLNGDGSVVLQSSDTIASTGGDDTITVGSGLSFVIAGVGNDIAQKNGSGEDVMIGDNGTILIDGSGHYTDAKTGNPALGGNDTLVGGSDRDILLGGAGNDSLRGNAGDNIMFGDGAEVTRNGLTVTAGSIDLFTGGNDTLADGPGNNLMVGGYGNNLFFGSTKNDILIGNYGRVVFTRSGPDAPEKVVSYITTGQGNLDLLRLGTIDLYNTATGSGTAGGAQRSGVTLPPPPADTGGSGVEDFFAAQTGSFLNILLNSQSGFVVQEQIEGDGAPFPGSFNPVTQDGSQDLAALQPAVPAASPPGGGEGSNGDVLLASADAPPPAPLMFAAEGDLSDDAAGMAMAGAIAWRSVSRSAATEAPRGVLGGLFRRASGRFRRWDQASHE